jgi:ribosomal protein S18 acetylase RimI-like enzyme
MKLTIRSISAQDIDPFHALFTQVLSTDFPNYSPIVLNHFFNTTYSKLNFLYWIENKLKSVLVAIENTETFVGFAVIDDPYGGVSLCRWLGVAKNKQRSGIGSRLVETWIDLAKKQGCHKAEVASQPQARGFYQKAGLQEEGMRKCSYFGIDQYLFGLTIGSPNQAILIK